MTRKNLSDWIFIVASYSYKSTGNTNVNCIAAFIAFLVLFLYPNPTSLFLLNAFLVTLAVNVLGRGIRAYYGKRHHVNGGSGFWSLFFDNGWDLTVR